MQPSYSAKQSPFWMWLQWVIKTTKNPTKQNCVQLETLVAEVQTEQQGLS